MRASEFKRLLQRQPFAPLRVRLTDGRAVDVRHPDQVLVTDRQIFIGLGYLDTGADVATPDTAEALAADWIAIDPLHVVSLSPANGRTKPRARRR